MSIRQSTVPLEGWKQNCLRKPREREATFVMLLLLILLIVLLIGATPAWPYSRGWGYPPVFLERFL
jgi:hypothetical protein